MRPSCGTGLAARRRRKRRGYKMRTTEVSRLVAACGAALLLAGAAQAGEWTYDSKKGLITHDDTGWGLRVSVKSGTDLTITGTAGQERMQLPMPPGLRHLPLGDAVVGGYRIIGIRAGVFSGNMDFVTSLTLPGSITTIANDVFVNFGGLTGVTIPAGVTRIGHYPFAYCRSLASVSIPASVTSIGENAFANCDALTGISVDDANTTYRDIGGVVFSKDGTRLVVCPAGRDGAYEIPAGVTTINDYAFADCGGLTAVTIPASVTRIGDSAFSGCDNLTSVAIPDGVLEISRWMFKGCDSLTDVTIPGSVTAIGYEAFSGCSRLADVTVPDSVTFIGKKAFAGCSDLASITLPASVTELGVEAFPEATRVIRLRLRGN